MEELTKDLRISKWVVRRPRKIRTKTADAANEYRVNFNIIDLICM